MIPLLLLTLSHSIYAETTQSPRGALIFQNRKADDISVSIEEACLPVLNPEKTHRLAGHGQKAIPYDLSAAGCIVLVTVEKELGVQTSLFRIEPLPQGGVETTANQSCKILVHSADTARRTYRLKSSCISISD